MKLYFGGAYNGKLALIKQKYNLKDDEIHFCYNNIDFSKKVICGIDKLVYFNILNNKNSLEYFKNNLPYLKDKIIICDEISQGIVPLKKEERIWREETGKIIQLLTKESSTVIRVFFGLEQILKGEKNDNLLN